MARLPSLVPPPLQLDRTLGQGEWIEASSYSGRMVEIGWRSTRSASRDGERPLCLPGRTRDFFGMARA
jgi:hypothetical protein